MKEKILGLDIGTSSVKAAIFDLAGNLIAIASTKYPLYSPHDGWAEQDPSDWLNGTFESIRQVTEQVNPGEIIALGLSGQSPSHALLDSVGNPLGMGIIWRDHRAVREAEWLRQNISPEEMEIWTGLKDIGDVTLPPARILWLKNHLPEEWTQARYIAHPKDYIGFALTGEMATDRETAFTLFNPSNGIYEPEFFDRLGIPLDRLPPIKQPVDIIGSITPGASVLTGLLPGTPVIAGTIDAFCDSLAGGATCPGWAVDVAGTSEVVSLGTRSLNSGKGVYLAGIGDSGHFLCGPTQTGGDTLSWLGRGFFPEVDTLKRFEVMEAEASSVPPGCNHVVFLPYLNGERAPVWDPMARGCFFGLSLEHNRKHITRAVYEGIGYSVRHILETCEDVSGEKAVQINICGGGSRSNYWNQVKANILQRPVYPTIISETACLGAAILAGKGIGGFPNLEDATQNMVRLRAPVEPQPGTAEIHNHGYQIYLSLYQALFPLFQRG